MARSLVSTCSVVRGERWDILFRGMLRLNEAQGGGWNVCNCLIRGFVRINSNQEPGPDWHQLVVISCNLWPDESGRPPPPCQVVISSPVCLGNNSSPTSPPPSDTSTSALQRAVATQIIKTNSNIARSQQSSILPQSWQSSDSSDTCQAWSGNKACWSCSSQMMMIHCTGLRERERERE